MQYMTRPLAQRCICSLRYPSDKDCAGDQNFETKGRGNIEHSLCMIRIAVLI